MDDCNYAKRYVACDGNGVDSRDRLSERVAEIVLCERFDYESARRSGYVQAKPSRRTGDEIRNTAGNSVSVGRRPGTLSGETARSSRRTYPYRTRSFAGYRRRILSSRQSFVGIVDPGVAIGHGR